MAKLFNKINKGFKRLFRISLFLISALLIIYFFPKSGKFKYSFENGRPWQSENLYAPFDFAIKKSDSEINKEIENAKLLSPVFFSQDTSVFLNKISSNIYTNNSFLKDAFCLVAFIYFNADPICNAYCLNSMIRLIIYIILCVYVLYIVCSLITWRKE